jgi:hypothetical protein
MYGILNQNLVHKVCDVSYNRIDSAMLGIQLIGDYSSYTIDHNNLNTTRINCGIEPPIGIDVQKYTNSYNATDQLVITNNYINIPFYVGKGIRNMNGNASQYIGNNVVKFTTTDNHRYRCTEGVDFSLIGIMNSNCDGTVIDGNIINGLHDTSAYNAQFSRGIYFEKSPNNKVTCNRVYYTKQGLYGVGDNFTDTTNIQNNKFRFNRNPLYTSDNGSPTVSTFGQIGGSNIENGNDWLYNTSNHSYLQNQFFKVWRNSNQQLYDQIKTSSTLLDPSESGATVLLNRYPVANITATYADPCPEGLIQNDPNDWNVTALTSWEHVDKDEAELIASGGIEYINFEEVAEWMNHKQLYDQLAQHPEMLESSSLLANFYNQQTATMIGTIEKSDIAMQSLLDFNGSNELFIEKYNDVLAENNLIASTKDYENYHRTMNSIGMKMARFGSDSISQTEQLELEVLANMCPYQAGNAVYKARTLYAVFNPMAQYNDRLNCLASTANKGGSNNAVTNIDSLEENQTNAQAQQLADYIHYSQAVDSAKTRQNKFAEMIQVYPNPTIDYIYLNYGSDKESKFILYNTLGEIVVKETIKSNSKIQLPTLCNGLYNYKLILDNETYNGKINIKK